MTGSTIPLAVGMQCLYCWQNSPSAETHQKIYVAQGFGRHIDYYCGITTSTWMNNSMHAVDGCQIQLGRHVVCEIQHGAMAPHG